MATNCLFPLVISTLMRAVDKVPVEVWTIILQYVPPPSLLPPPQDDLINNVKLLADDCELPVVCTQDRASLGTVCKKWNTAIKSTRHFFLLPGSLNTLPSGFRVQFPTACECRVRGCQMANPPPLERYGACTQPMQAFLDASTYSNRGVEEIIAENAGLWLLSIAVDFSYFSLPALSSSCRRLTHLSFSEFHLADSTKCQMLDLPMLNTLILNFFNPGATFPPPAQPQQVHHSYRNWRLPSLRNLSMKGWVSDTTPDFLDEINGILPRVGPTLQGLLYKLWRHSDTREYILYPLPSSLWEWCPHLRTIQTALKALLACPKPPPEHPRLIFVPVHLGDLDTLPDNMTNLVWPKDLIEDVQNGEPWPIDVVRISTTWATFHRKLLDMHENPRPFNPNQLPEGQTSTAPADWPEYFSDWAQILIEKPYAIQDRHCVDVRQGDGALLLEWLASIAPPWFFVGRGSQ